MHMQNAQINVPPVACKQVDKMQHIALHGF